MRQLPPTFGQLATGLLFLSLAPFTAGTMAAQGKSPEDLVDFLTYRSERSGRELALLGMSSCGQFGADREAARSLVKIGAPALPGIERALDSIETLGERSEFAFNSGWLVAAYAGIKGLGAYPRLQRMLNNPNLAFLRSAMDPSIALALNLTSYVSAFRPAGRTFRCGRGAEPRDALDQLVFAWGKGDLPLFENALGPSGRAALTSMLRSRTWATIRLDLSHGKVDPDFAMGYRFENGGPWSEPEELNDDAGREAGVPNPQSPELDTRFSSGPVGECGRYPVKFLRTRDATSDSTVYLVDDPGLRDLLHIIGSCSLSNRTMSDR